MVSTLFTLEGCPEEGLSAKHPYFFVALKVTPPPQIKPKKDLRPHLMEAFEHLLNRGRSISLQKINLFMKRSIQF